LMTIQTIGESPKQIVHQSLFLPKLTGATIRLAEEWHRKVSDATLHFTLGRSEPPAIR
jgi:hypothetical protein